MKNLIKSTSQYFLVVLSLLPIELYAHPHNWIDLKTEFILDEKGQLTQLLQHWKFDVYYSAIKLADIEKEYDSQQQGLRKLAKEMAESLKNYDYFSELKIENQSVMLPKPSDYLLNTIVKEGQQQLLLTMRFRMNNSPDIKRKTLSWRVFDPSYYIDMRHQKSSQILIRNGKSRECSVDIETPKPSTEIIKYATSLDRSQKDTKGLGSYFAEKVLINCL
jgi:ABC-type uncharacterized transport system substrate-binding protein